MTQNRDGTEEIECALTFELARQHGWSSETPVHDLVSDANIQGEKRARKVARNQLSDRGFIGFHPGKDTIWLDPPPTDDLAYWLRDTCGYMELQIEATLDSYFDGFD